MNNHITQFGVWLVAMLIFASLAACANRGTRGEVDYNVWEARTRVVAGEELRYKRKHVQVTNGDITLSGALFVPVDESTTMFPAVVLCHGSGPRVHEDLNLYTFISLRLGMAALALDKRGVGRSEGEYKAEFQYVENSEWWFQLLASDLLAGLNWLKAQDQIDTLRLGLMGGSQAGWIMPLATSKDTSIRFIISGAGPVCSYGEENFFSYLTKNGAPVPGRKSIKTADSMMKDFNGPHGYETLPVLERLDTNILWKFGTNDPVIPVDLSLRYLEALNKPNYETVILPDANHNFVNTRTRKRYDLVQYIQPWLEEIGILDKPDASPVAKKQ